MHDSVILVAQWAVSIIELLGIGIITLTAVYSIAVAGYHIAKQYDARGVFQEVRQRLGRGILLGLEFLVAADIIMTVTVDLTFESVGTLALIVMVRTFLSFTLDVELTGRWPWQPEREKSEPL
ncbi:DUF1622 domain-containing protein [Halopseudomonas salina]|uniref:Membrane protein n=1 Tax=Halopseudomonas salina TaxID=1323744 RepID=A0ABQ1Q097_9GAMM|nr:DUF1622 domain-containing protein [Halopseudomonas salina]GGD07988.1 membrane protein [Halopseudomonas salina]